MIILKPRFFDQGADGFGRIGRPYCVLPLIAYGIGVGLSALATWWGTEKQKQSQQEAIAANKATSAEELQLHKKEYGDAMKLQTQKASTERANTLTNIKFKEEDENWGRQQTMANRLLGLINTQASLKESVLNGIAAKKQLNQPSNYSALNPIIGPR
jgi:hypothetical protein